jgi:hypothetical protein
VFVLLLLLLLLKQCHSGSCYKPLSFSFEIPMWGGDFFFPLLLPSFLVFLPKQPGKLARERRVKSQCWLIGSRPNEPRIPLGILVDGTESCGTEGLNS